MGTRIEDIAAAANYAVGSFYTYFSSKEDVLLAASRADTSVRCPDTSWAGSAGLTHIVGGLAERCRARLDLDTAMEQAALRSPSVLEQWRHDRRGSVASLSDALREAPESESLSDDELSSVSSALLSMTEQVGRLELDVELDVAAEVWALSLGAGAVETTPITASVEFAPRPTPEPMSGSKGRLLAAAERLFDAEPWGSVSVARIAETAGVANGTFYRHFDSKASILASLVDGSPSSLFPAVSRGTSQSFPDNLFHLLMTHMDGVARSAGLWSVVTEALYDEPSIRASVVRARRQWYASVLDVVRDWQRSGEVPRHVDIAGELPLLTAMLEREAFVVGVLSRPPEGGYEHTATVRDCWWRVLTRS